MLYTLVMSLFIATTGGDKVIVVPGFLSAASCDAAAADVLKLQKTKYSSATAIHCCLPNETPNS